MAVKLLQLLTGQALDSACSTSGASCLMVFLTLLVIMMVLTKRCDQGQDNAVWWCENSCCVFWSSTTGQLETLSGQAVCTNQHTAD